MLIVKLTQEELGTRQNQLSDEKLAAIPQGFVEIPQELCETALGYLPWLGIELDEGGLVSAVFENSAQKLAYESAGEEGENELN